MWKAVRTIMLCCVLTVGALQAEASATEQVTFVVHCYDVGAKALESRPGVISVERGWLGSREVDRVAFDPRQVSREQLESWLRATDTYIETLQEPGRD